MITSFSVIIAEGSTSGRSREPEPEQKGGSVNELGGNCLGDVLRGWE